MAEGFFEMRGKHVCKACGHDGGKVTDRFWCAREGCPNGENPAAPAEKMATDAVASMAKQIRTIGEACAVMCDGLEAFVHYTPPDKAINSLSAARRELFAAVAALHKSLEPDPWTPEALAQLAGAKKE